MPWTQPSDIAEFLTTRRAKVTPEQAGLPTYGPRRVKGLRREEVASLAGVSVEYYKRLERGNVSGVSELVLEGLARALQLDDAERAHLFDLARAANPVDPRRPRPVKQQIRPVVQRILDSGRRAGHRAQRPARLPRRQRAGPSALRAGVRQPRAAGQLRALHLPGSRRRRVLSPTGTASPPTLVAHLRSEAGRNPFDRQLSDLIGELSTRSDEFRVRWAAHNVRFHRTGTKRLHHPVVGDLELAYETMELTADDGLSVAVFTAEPGSASQQALDLLASWTATPSRPTTSPHEPRTVRQPLMQITRRRRHAEGPGRLVHRRRLHRRRRRPRRHVHDRGRARALHARRAHRLAHPPARPDDLRHRGRRALPARRRPVEVIRPGDRVFFEPGENHWHGAAPDRFMVHIAIQQADESGSPVTWGRHVTDEEYDRASA